MTRVDSTSERRENPEALVKSDRGVLVALPRALPSAHLSIKRSVGRERIVISRFRARASRRGGLSFRLASGRDEV